MILSNYIITGIYVYKSDGEDDEDYGGTYTVPVCTVPLDTTVDIKSRTYDKIYVIGEHNAQYYCSSSSIVQHCCIIASTALQVYNRTVGPRFVCFGFLA